MVGAAQMWVRHLFLSCLHTVPLLSQSALPLTHSLGYTCVDSLFGSCCSTSGYCGFTPSFCSSQQCLYGNCTLSTPSPVPFLPSDSAISTMSPPPLQTSYTGSCGGSTALTCLDSPFGNCCSCSGFCGETNAFCGLGCNLAFGTCWRMGRPYNVEPNSSPYERPFKQSPDGRCGGKEGYVCQGSGWGNCCSEEGTW
ncbi:hypothetical protein EV356DRAFT_508772 [Viridothelium virens]|uniref:Chitin-binding type-1 domain-containing protein n=1 Tax=Viridothelium virens TaxID=1048519 RepID=A0A6A6HJA7_VIRVR|nr:hypothetical protein EV356DRAFT_508772 [Viridothelium virens]